MRCGGHARTAGKQGACRCPSMGRKNARKRGRAQPPQRVCRAGAIEEDDHRTIGSMAHRRVAAEAPHVAAGARHRSIAAANCCRSAPSPERPASPPIRFPADRLPVASARAPRWPDKAGGATTKPETLAGPAGGSSTQATAWRSEPPSRGADRPRARRRACRSAGRESGSSHHVSAFSDATRSRTSATSASTSLAPTRTPEMPAHVLPWMTHTRSSANRSTSFEIHV